METELIFRFYKEVTCPSQCVMGQEQHGTDRKETVASFHSPMPLLKYCGLVSPSLAPLLLPPCSLPSPREFKCMNATSVSLKSLTVQPPHGHYPENALLWSQTSCHRKGLTFKISVPLVDSLPQLNTTPLPPQKGASTTEPINDLLSKSDW